MKNTQELPKWFTNSGGVCYKKGNKVTNFLSNNNSPFNTLRLNYKFSIVKVWLSAKQKFYRKCIQITFCDKK
jgi:hypothetical protein